LQEALSVNDNALGIRRTFLGLIKNIQGMYQDLLRNEELPNQQVEGLHTTKEAWRKIAEYQEKHQAEHIKRYSPMELKHFQAMLNSGENLTEEAGSAITDARKECYKIWEAAAALTEEAGLTRIEGLGTSSLENLSMEVVDKSHQAKERDLRQIKDLRWEHAKGLVDVTRL